MRNILLAVVSILVLEGLFHSCANPKAPTGGAKDTIPPSLIESSPKDQALNFKGQTVILKFDERVSDEKLQSNLIITPTTEAKFKSFVKKNIVTLKFDQPFEDSTTYTLNFFEGIMDITEKNPAENLTIAFSTGDFIDSLSITGKVFDLFTGKAMEKVTVGLYRYTDTLDFNQVKPTYFTNSMKQGTFHIQNIKNNKYRLLAFKDNNRNLLFDPASESYAFKSTIIDLDSSITDSLELPVVSISASELALISARESGKYFEARYTKPIDKYSYQTEDSIYLPSRIVGEGSAIRFYPIDYVIDSVQTVITTIDSLGNQQLDTLFVKFRESSRKSEDYGISLSPKKKSPILSDTEFELSFNKPSQFLDSSFLMVKLDTIDSIYVEPMDPQFNHNRTSLSFGLSYNQSFQTAWIDSLKQLYPVDTTNIDSANLRMQNILARFNPEVFLLKVNPASFISIENDTSQSIIHPYVFANPVNFGVIRIQINTQNPSYYVQLIASQKVVAEKQNCTNCVFTYVPPGEYTVRVLIDANNDGKWSYGNFLQNIEPEPVIHFTEVTSLRANWEVELQYSF